MRSTMLSEAQAAFLREEKEKLASLQVALSKLNLPRETLKNLSNAILQLDELFLIVVAGEFNAGKSALLNALFGEKILKEGATPTTSQVTLVKWGEKIEEKTLEEGFVRYTHPLPLLRELTIVDTPGTNAVIRQHERLTSEFVPRSDLVLFVTSADRPMTESERQFLEKILQWGKKVVFVLNKVDIFDDQSDLQEVLDFVREHATALLGETPVIFPVSAKLAQRAQAETDAATRDSLRDASRLDALEDYITATLDEAARLELKLKNPLGIADQVLVQVGERVEGRRALLDEDFKTVHAIETALAAYKSELDAELVPRLAEVENILHRIEYRGIDFFDSKLRLTNIHELMRGAKIRADFEKEVLDDMPAQIEKQVQRLIDWLVQKDLNEWRQVMGYLQRRQAEHVDHLVGEAYAPRDTRRRDLIDKVGESVELIVESYDQRKEASQLAAKVETAVGQTALLEAGAVGLGALVTLVIASSALDITGTLAAGTMAIVGIFVIPFRRKQAKDDFREKISTLRAQLVDTLTRQFTLEKEAMLTRMKEGVTPYLRYIRSEGERLEEEESFLEEWMRDLAELRLRCDEVLAE